MAVYYEDGVIKEVGKTNTVKAAHEDATYVDVQNKLLMPGLINAHTSIDSTFNRYIIDDAFISCDPSYKRNMWFEYRPAHDIDDVYLRSAITHIEALKAGTTTVGILYDNYRDLPGELDKVRDAAVDTGIRASIAYALDGGLMHNDGFERLLKSNEFLKTVYPSPGTQANPRIGAMFGAVSRNSCDSNALRFYNNFRDQDHLVGRASCHMHAYNEEDEHIWWDYENQLSNPEAMEKYRQRGWLDENVIVAGMGFASNNLVSTVLHANARIVLSQISRVASNLPCLNPWEVILRKRFSHCIGTDGLGQSMFYEAMTNYLLSHRLANDSDFYPDLLAALTMSNAIAFSRQFPHPIGMLIPNSFADILIVDYNPAVEMTTENFFYHMIFGIDESMIKKVIVNGEDVVENGRMLKIDEDAIFEQMRAKYTR